MTNENPTLEQILDRGIVTDLYPSKEEFIKAAKSRKLRFYIGFDATGPTLHLSHAKNFLLLEEFRKLGHEVIVLFGDFTARIGDPSDRSAARVRLTKEEVDKNVEAWKKQIRPLMDFDAKDNPPQIKYNSEWLSRQSFEDVLDLAANFTVQQLIERDMFQKRLKENKPIHLHEFLYPVMQGFDSVAMDVDVEMCGTDQTFNALAGRTLMKKLKDKEKFVMAVTLMEDPETGLLMSKSQGTGVFLNTDAEEMFRGIMALPDSMTELLLINNTRVPLDEIKSIMQKDPLESKLQVADIITAIFHGEDEAKKAHEEFDRKVRSKTYNDDDFQEIKLEDGQTYKAALLGAKIVSSGNELKRLIEAGAVKNLDSNDTVSDENSPAKPGKYKIGKKRLIKLV